MRKLTLILLPFCVLYFVVGGALVLMGIFPTQMFLAGSGVVGTLASVLSLIAFIRPALTPDDFASVEADTLKKLGEVTSEIKELEEAKAEAATQIDDLEKQRQEMELLVRKASMSLFLREQHAHHEREILSFVNSNPEISRHLAELASTERKLEALEEEIENSENVDQLRSIIASASRKSETLVEIIEHSPPNLRILFKLIKAYFHAIDRAFGMRK